MATFIESPRFPDDMAYWANGGPQFNTSIIQLNSGFEQRNINWNESRAVYSITEALRTQTDQFAIAETIAFFRAMKGRAYGFRFKDFQDYKVSTSTGLVGTGLGTGILSTYQLNKKFIAGSLIDLKKIRKPVGSTVKIYINSVLQSVGTNYTLDSTTGLVTFLPKSILTILSISVGATPIVTTTTNHNLLSGQNVYISGIGSNPLNNQYYTVTVTSPTTFTITTANATLVSSGSVSLYPQVSDVLTWEGEFDIACRFDMDVLNHSVTDGGLINLDNITIVEIRV